MDSQWPFHALNKFIEVKHGFAFKSNYFCDKGHILLTPGNFYETGGFRWLGSKQKYYSGDVHETYVLKKGDVLVAMTEQAAGLLGSTIIIPENGKFLHNQRLGLIKIKDENLLSRNYVYHLFNSIFVRRPIFDTAAGTKVRHTSPGKIGKIMVPIPTLPHQKRISGVLFTWDQAIEETEKLIVAKGTRYAHLVSSLIANERHPRWHIRDITVEISQRNSSAAIDRVLSVTNNNGFVLPEDQFERRVASSDLSHYKIVTRGQYAYNPSRINVGSIARLDRWGKGVLSPMYVVFQINEQKVNSDFFLHWLESHEAKERIRKSAQGSVRETVSFNDLGAISFPLPLLQQQISIAKTLNTARLEIDLLKKQVEAYRKQKHGLMQKLLTGQWRMKTKEENA
jgi:type I restriction enzyme, S subunit